MPVQAKHTCRMGVGGPSCTGIDKVSHARSSHNKTRSLNVHLEHLQQDLTVLYKTRLGVCSLSLRHVISCTWLWITHFPRVKSDGAAFVDADAIICTNRDWTWSTWRQTISSWHVKIQDLNLTWIHCEMTTKTPWSTCRYPYGMCMCKVYTANVMMHAFQYRFWNRIRTHTHIYTHIYIYI